MTTYRPTFPWPRSLLAHGLPAWLVTWITGKYPSKWRNWTPLLIKSPFLNGVVLLLPQFLNALCLLLQILYLLQLTLSLSKALQVMFLSYLQAQTELLLVTEHEL